MKLTSLALACALAPGLLFAAPATKIKPGLWESTSKMGAGDSRMQQAMAMLQSLPPEQRKMMESAMAKQGVSMSADGGVQAKVCVSKEMAEANQLPMQQRGSCTYQHGPLVGGAMKFSFSCTNPTASGEGSVNFAGDSSYDGNMQIKSSATGQAETVNVQTSGRWLAADCGAIKPMAMPAADK
ncbi:MAG: DUF3617 domain-containing protein [Massilia sp.]